MTRNIRETSAHDLELILDIHQRAFNAEGEANLVSNLLKDPTAKPLLSLLALEDNIAVGHILFSKVTIHPSVSLSASILAPLAVIPNYQRQGIGRLLITTGLEKLKMNGVDLVFVLGDPSYYQRYGFRQAEKLGFMPPYTLTQEYLEGWMVYPLSNEIIGNYQGRIICAEALKPIEYWHE
jgi:putative acetyltransferase